MTLGATERIWHDEGVEFQDIDCGFRATVRPAVLTRPATFKARRLSRARRQLGVTAIVGRA
jgi:hypothetical protein